MTRDELIWLAGFLDGEGYIGIVRKGTVRYQAQVRVGATHKATMRHVARLLDNPPINIWHFDKRLNCKPCYVVCIYDKKAEELCRNLLPFLHCKRKQAENLLQFRTTVEYGRNQYSKPRRNQIKFHKKSRLLNQRGLIAA